MNDFLILFLLVVVQWRVTALLFGVAGRRWSGRKLLAARASVLLFDAAVVFGFLLSLPDVMVSLHLPGTPSLVAGAAALVYFVSSTGALVVWYIAKLFHRIFDHRMDPGRRRVLRTAGNVLMASPLAALAAGFVARTDFHVREIDMPVSGLPDALHGLRVLHLSDIHLSAFLSERELARVIDASNGLHANLAVITGDLISTFGDPLDACIRQLARLKSDAGSFGCLGNHEHYVRAEDYAQTAAARAGIRFLRGQAETLRFGGARLRLAGVDYQPKSQQAWYLHGAERLIEPGAVNLLLSHNPDVFPVAVRQGWDVMLAGHTHGGQVTVEILEQTLNPARFFTPYVYGLYRSANSAAYVTRGIGTIGIPARIGAQPEITLVRLRKA
jgi:predicted MPP superfamily phosphohydrolase